MAIAGSSNIEYRKDEKTRYVEEDNVKDITKDDLTSLKSTLKEKEIDLDTQLTKINDNVEDIFDGFLSNKRETSVSITRADGKIIIDTPKNIITEGVKANLDALANYVIENSGYKMELDKLKNDEVKTELNNYKFELRNLRKEVSGDEGSDKGDDDLEANVELRDKGDEVEEDTKEKDKEVNEKYESINDYIDPYKQTGVGYATIGKDMDIANIYKDNKLPKYMEAIFNGEEKEEIKKGIFRINLSKENGLAGIVIDIREAVAVGNSNDPDIESAPYKLYEALTDQGVLNNEEPIELSISKEQLKELVDGKFLTYKDTKALSFNEIDKVAKILDNAQRSDLERFTSLLQSKSDEAMSVKELYNADLIITNNLINEDNVLPFLCDFNSDGQVATEYKRKNNKEQKNQGDVGTLFGQQVMFTIEQAIGVKNIEMGEPAGEQLVIQNIIKNMQISDNRKLDDIQKLPLLTMAGDLTKCTKENLAKVFNGDEEEGILPMPEMKIFFLDSIKKINGGSREVTPDLYDTLIGKDSESLLALYNTEVKLRIEIDKILEDSKDPATIEMIRKHGLVRVRETIFTKIMTAIDNVEITTNNGAQTQLQAAGISKGREIHELKRELMENTIKSLILSGIHYSITGGWRFSIGYGKSGTSESGRTKRARGAGPGLIIGKEKVELAIELGGEIAEQYNINKVINADLSQVKSAKYLGIEGGAIVAIGSKTADAELYAGINRQQDPVVGINQIDKQYTSLSAEIFNVRGASVATLADKDLFRAHIKNHITALKGDGTYGKFVTKNEQHLTDDLDFMVRYMEANKFFGEAGIITKFPKANISQSLNELVNIIQSGNIEQRRHDVMTGLHSSFDVTKLSFGVTTNALTLRSQGGKNTPAPTPGVSSGETNEGGNINSGGDAGASEVDFGQDRFGICGYYIGLRISTWRNSYVPNEAQYLFTQYETGQGIGLEKFEENPYKNLERYGAYLEALYNDSNISASTDAGRLIISLSENAPQKDDENYIPLYKRLNIHATKEAEKSFSLNGDVLVIGNVGDIAAYTITEAKGVRRILCLGSKKVDEAARITGDLGASSVDEMKPVVETNKTRTQEKIRTNIITNMKGEGNNLEFAKTETSAFFNLDGKLVTPTGPEWVGKTIVFEPSTIENKTFEQGSILIQKNTDGISYIVTVDVNNPDNALDVIYRDQKEYDEARIIAQQLPENREAPKTTEVKNFFEFTGDMDLASKEIVKLLSSLEELENAQPQVYADFLIQSSTITAGKEIDDEALSLAVTSLEILMSNNKNTPTFTILKGFLDGQNGKTKSYIVDRMKQILAREPMYKKMNIGTILTNHHGWEKVKGPSNVGLPTALKIEMQRNRTSLAKDYATEKYKTNPTIDPNLIGYTAFYRERAQRYSITSLGETGYQGALKPITKNIDQAKSWFFGNLTLNRYEVDRLAASLEAQFLKQGTAISIQQDTTEGTVDMFKTLMNGDGFIIDNGDKISIDVDWVFYLLGDCCNESLGMKIKNINVTKFIPGTIIAGRYGAEGLSDKEYKGGMDLFTKSHSITNRVITKEEKASLKYFRNHTDKPTPGVTSGADGSGGSGGTTDPGVIDSGTDGGNE